MPDPIKPNPRAIQHYYERLKSISAQRVDHEMAVRSAFQQLLTDTAHARGWTFIPEVAKHSSVPGRASIRPDGVVRDENTLPRGYWEAKDSADSLEHVLDLVDVVEVIHGKLTAPRGEGIPVTEGGEEG